MGIIDLVGRGIARLAGGARVLEEVGQVAKPKNLAMRLLETGYNHPVGRFAVGSVEDTGFGMMFGASPLEAGASAVTGRAGAFAGSALGRRLGGEAGQNIGEFVGGAAGQVGGMYIPQALGLVPEIQSAVSTGMGNPDSAQQDPRQAQSDQQMMSQLTPDQIQKLQNQAARKAAQAQYQAQAMQQYGGYQ